MTLKIGQRRRWESKTYAGTGKIVAIKPTGRGNYVTLKTKDHPTGQVSVRESQVRPV